MRERHIVYALPISIQETSAPIGQFTDTKNWYFRNTNDLPRGIGHHLYFTRIVDVKDHCYYLYNGTVCYGNPMGRVAQIIASTNKSVWSVEKEMGFRQTTKDTDVAKIGQEFIQAFVERDGIWEVDLEMENICFCGNPMKPHNYRHPARVASTRPKLRPDGTVIVHPIKEGVSNKDIAYLEWLYDRMVYVHKEDEHYDYMLKFKSIINNLKPKQ